MKIPIVEIERRMKLGGWYTDKMLLEGDSLSRTIDEDASALNSLNLTTISIGEKIFLLISQAKDTDWFKPLITDNYMVEIHRRRGIITCPWAPNELEPCNFNNWRPTADEFMISNRINGVSISGLILSIHMLKEHCFFGGRGTKSRIEPHIFAELLKSRN